MTEQQRRQEMEARMARLTNETADEKLPPVSEPPKPSVPNLTVESPVVPPVIEQPVAYSPPVKSAPPLAKPTSPAETPLASYLQPTSKKPVNWAAWAIGLVLLAVVAEVIWLLIS